MIKKTLKTIGLILAAAVLTDAQAADIGAQGVKIIPPAGSEMLPGAGIAGNSIESSFIFSKLLPFAIKFGIQLSIAAAVIVIILAGYNFITSMGDAEKKSGAMNTIVYAMIGLVIAILAYAIVNIITSVPLTLVPRALAQGVTAESVEIPPQSSVAPTARKEDTKNAMEAVQKQMSVKLDTLARRITALNANDPQRDALNDALDRNRGAIEAFTELDAGNHVQTIETPDGNLYGPDAEFINAESKASLAANAINRVFIDPVKPQTQLPEGDLFKDFIPQAIRLLFRFAYFAILVMMMAAGVMQIVAFDNEELIQKSRQIMIWSLMGFGVISFAFAVVKAVTNIDFFGFI